MNIERPKYLIKTLFKILYFFYKIQSEPLHFEFLFFENLYVFFLNIDVVFVLLKQFIIDRLVYS